jgi:hypothetical protein
MTQLLQQSVVRLQAEVYQQLEDKLSRSMVSATTTELEAGFKLGVEHVLQHLRKGFVVNTSGPRPV